MIKNIKKIKKIKKKMTELMSLSVLLPLAVALLLFQVTLAMADPVLEAPSEVRLGQPFVIKVKAAGEEPTGATLTWLGREARLLPEKDGSFSALLGTDFKKERPKEGTLTVTIRLADGRKSTVSRRLRIAPYSYPSENIKVEKAKLNPPKELARRIEKEAALGRAALATSTEGRAPKLPLVRPVPGVLTSVYGKSRYFNGEFRGRHGGVDMRAKEGTPVKAAADGTVVLAGSFWFAGNCVYIDHGAGFITFYCHLSRLSVRNGESVKAGEVLGFSGKTGRVTGPHLHFSTIWRGQFFDPAAIMEK